jgi:hypothetical protein
MPERAGNLPDQTKNSMTLRARSDEFKGDSKKKGFITKREKKCGFSYFSKICLL